MLLAKEVAYEIEFPHLSQFSLWFRTNMGGIASCIPGATLLRLHCDNIYSFNACVYTGLNVPVFISHLTMVCVRCSPKTMSSPETVCRMD